MRKLISLAFAALPALVSFASGDTPKEWYLPNEYAEKKTECVLNINRKDMTLPTDDRGVPIIDTDTYNSFSEAQKNAFNAITQAKIAQAQVETLADTMYGILVTDGLTMTGKDANGNAISYKIKFKKGGDGKISKDGGNIEAETEATFNNLPDNATIQWTPSGKAHLQLYGKPTNAVDGEGKFPMFNGSTLTWAALKPYFDTKCFTVETVSNARIKDEGIYLHGWKDEEKTGSDFEIATVMTDERDYSGCYSLVYNGGTLQYWKFGKLDKKDGFAVDNESIVTNDDQMIGKATIKGYVDAVQGDLVSKGSGGTKWVSLGKTLKYDGENSDTIEVDVGGGLEIDSINENLAVKPGAGLVIGEDGDVAFNIGAGLEFYDGEFGEEVDVALADDGGLEFRVGEEAFEIALQQFEDGRVRGWTGTAWQEIVGLECDDKTITTNDTGLIHLKVDGGNDGDALVKNGDGLKWTAKTNMRADEKSISTNDTESGSVAVVGFPKAKSCAVPYRGNDLMQWSGEGSKGAILQRGESGVDWTTTQSGNYYYGTPKNGGDLGWHELPNVTTNAVEADDATLKSILKDGDVKELSLYSAPGGDGRLYGAFMAGGKLGWAAVAESPTNQQYGVDAVSIDTNGVGGVLQIAGFKDKLGTGFLTKFGGKVISASMGFTNGLTRTETADGDYNLKIDVGLENWDTPSGTCAENLGGILTGQIAEADGDHYVLTRCKDGNLHYTKIGRVPNVPPDGVTISTNETGHANQLAIAGAYDNEGKFLKSTGSGTEWASAGGSPVDNASITTNASAGATADGVASIRGFDSAAPNALLYKDGNNAAWIAPPQGASASAPKVLTFDGSTVAWGDAAGGGAAVDGVSITTNAADGAVTDGLASLYGFNLAPAGLTPVVKIESGSRVLRWGTTGNFALTYNNGTYTIDEGYFGIARNRVHCSGTTTTSTGWVVLKVNMQTSGASGEILTGQSTIPQSTDSITYFGMYQIGTNAVYDRRFMPFVQAWE